MNADCLKLTTYFGERDRAAGGFLADALADVYARQELQVSVVLRGIEGFGLKHHLRTDRLLTLSEDLPIVSVAVDTRRRIQAALPEVAGLVGHGLITLERARILDGALDAVELPDDLQATKLTIYVGRGESAGSKPAHLAIVELLHDHGVAGASVMLGVDGTAHGVRERARFFAANTHVPMMIISIGDGARIAGVLPRLAEIIERPLVTLERVEICKRDGERLAEPSRLPEADASGLGIWQKLMVYSSEQSRHADRPLHHEIVRALRAEGAVGATSLRGIWGYHGSHEPHGDSLWQLRRRVPVVTVIVDSPERIQRWFAIVDELTSETGLVTSEMVPAFHSRSPAAERGGLRLAEGA